MLSSRPIREFVWVFVNGAPSSDLINSISSGIISDTESSTERSPTMNTIPAQEIKRRGIAAVDELIGKGDLHIIRNNQPQYVVLSQKRYEDLLEAEEEAQVARIRASLEDLKAGRVKRGTAEDLIRELGLED
jgi:PHD/YefM family antitoxin component YafN of YafNO toxin-antitoxin module